MNVPRTAARTDDRLAAIYPGDHQHVHPRPAASSGPTASLRWHLGHAAVVRESEWSDPTLYAEFCTEWEM